jgi:hypothetical protein
VTSEAEAIGGFVQARIKAHAAGVLLAFLGFVLGFGLGAVFGANEEGVKQHLEAEGRAALATEYDGDEAAMKKVTSKSWSYMKRAHLHAGVLGATSMATILLLALIAPPSITGRICSTLLGLGAPLYGLFWMLAALDAPGLGSTSAGKAANEFVGLIGSGSVIVGTLGALVLVVMALFRKPAA